MNLVKVNTIIGAASLVIILLLSLMLFEVTGLRVMFTVILLFFIPSYLILRNFELEQDEKIIYSLFLGLGIFPSLVYWLGLLTSITTAVMIVFVVLMLFSLVLPKFIKN